MQTEPIKNRISHDLEAISLHSKKIEYLQSCFNRLLKRQYSNYALEPEAVYEDNDPIINLVSSWDIPEVQSWILDKILEIEKRGKRYGVTLMTAFDIPQNKQKEFSHSLKELETKKQIELERESGRIILLMKSKRRGAIDIYLKIKKYSASQLHDPWATISQWFIYREKGKFKNIPRKKLSETFNDFYR